MIRYSLKCAKDHSFDSWFASSAAFEALAKSGHLACAVCGVADVTKTLMAPAVSAEADRPLSAPGSAAEQALADLRRKVEENSEYVGLSFAAQARAMHDGDAPARSIYGEARIDEARALIEDGVPVGPLPFAPRKRAN